MSNRAKIDLFGRYQKEKKLKSLTDRDYQALNSIYNFRCLSYEQIYELHYKYSEKTGKINTTDYSKRKMTLFMKLGIIREIKVYDKNMPLLYQLTMEGINILRKQLQWPENIYDEKSHLHVKGYLTESELNVKERFMPHQYNLNCFVLRLMEHFKDIPYKYEDEKHLKSFVNIRPDGAFTIGDITFFLEMDMGTEGSKQLQEKWNNYRNFINSNEYVFRERRVVILFIVDGIVKVNQRLALIKDTVNKNFIDCFNYGIELYINTPDKLIETLKERILPELKGTYKKIYKTQKTLFDKKYKIVNNPDTISKYFNGQNYSFFVRKNINDKSYDYLFDNFDEEPMSVIYRALFFDNLTNRFKSSMDSNLRLVLICKDEKTAFRNYNIFQLKDILFTTYDKINNLPFNEAIFSFDANGTMYSYEDENLLTLKANGIIKL